jgi:hypothetical protein
LGLKQSIDGSVRDAPEDDWTLSTRVARVSSVTAITVLLVPKSTPTDMIFTQALCTAD